MIIAIEGIDGVGKGTQSKLLYDCLINEGHKASLISFPDYSGFFGQMVGEYLNGKFGTIDVIHPKLAAILYALDRWQKFKERDNLLSDDYLILDRYVPSNLAHHAAKLKGGERTDLINWISELEYDILGLPRPDLVIVLDADTKLAESQVLKKKSRKYTSLAKDLHESDPVYLEEVRKVFLHLCSANESYTRIECDAEGKMKSIEEISQEIRRAVFG